MRSPLRGVFLAAIGFFAFALMSALVSARSEAAQSDRAVVLSAELVKGTLIYRLDGKIVEDSKRNSLLQNLGKVAEARGLDVPVLIVIDERARFSEVGKLKTALDKVDFHSSPKIFVADFSDGSMNEIHWDETAVPIPAPTR